MKTTLTGLALWLVCATTALADKVALIKIDGAIGPATASYISRSIDVARAMNAQCLVIQLNTPGGLLDSTQTIVQSFLGSTLPVAVYVAPTGASATSAGCFITIAASVAAMAPATTIGAAHPVSAPCVPPPRLDPARTCVAGPWAGRQAAGGRVSVQSTISRRPANNHWPSCLMSSS